jgi:acetylornithine deacetylase/succinyl-diaminopimelate desuccinylase-like protein
MVKSILKRLVSYKTLSADHATNLLALRWFYNQVKALPVHAKFYSLGGFPSLLITTRKTRQPKILLAAHMDVVNASPEMFRLQQKGTKLFGRGTFDMKFAAASYLATLKDLGPRLKDYDLGVLLTTDEEIGGEHGVKALLQKGLRCEFCVIPDGGSNWSIEQGAKGAIQMRVESVGKSAHGSRIWQGKNAIDQLIKFLDQIRALFPSEPCGMPDHWHHTFNLGQISGGMAANSIPDYAEAKINIRLTEKTSIAQMLRRLREIKRNYPQIKLTVLSATAPYRILDKAPLFRKFVSVLEQNRHRKAVFTRSHGACDARYFLMHDIPVVSLRPVGGGHHSEEEWIDLKSLEQFGTVLKQFLLENAKR